MFRSKKIRRNRSRDIEKGLEEIELITDGISFFDHDGQEWKLGCGAILWHVAGERTIARTLPENPYQCLVIAFEVDEGAPRCAPRLGFWNDPAAVRSFARDCVTAFHAGQGDDPLFLAWVVSTLRWRSTSGGVTAHRPQVPSVLRRLLDTIEHRFDEDIGIDDLAAQAGVSAPHLHHLCRQHLQTTPGKLLARRRLRRARVLLAEEDRHVKDIAHACGYSDTGSFCRWFRQHQGISPLAYRAATAPPH